MVSRLGSLLVCTSTQTHSRTPKLAERMEIKEVRQGSDEVLGRIAAVLAHPQATTALAHLHPVAAATAGQGRLRVRRNRGPPDGGLPPAKNSSPSPLS